MKNSTKKKKKENGPAPSSTTASCEEDSRNNMKQKIPRRNYGTGVWKERLSHAVQYMKEINVCEIDKK